MIREARIGPVTRAQFLQQEPMAGEPSISSPWIEVTDYPTFQHAIDAAEAAGKAVHVLAGDYDHTTTPQVNPGGLLLSTGSTAFKGDGMNLSRIHHTGSATTPLFRLAGPLSYLSFEDLMLGGANINGSGHGFDLNGMSESSFRNVRFDLFPSWALYHDDATNDSVDVKFDGCSFKRSRTNGIMRLGHKCFGWHFANSVWVGQLAGRSVELHGTQRASFDHCGFEHGLNVQSDTDTFYINQIGAYPQGVLLRNCWHECTAPGVTTPAGWFIFVNGACYGFELDYCRFVRSTGSSVRIMKSGGTDGMIGTVIRHPWGSVGSVPVGADDFVFKASDVVTIEGGMVQDTANTVRKDLSVVHANSIGGLICVDAGKRSKLRGLTNAEITAIADPHEGDITYNATKKQYMGRTNNWNRLGYPHHNAMDFIDRGLTIQQTYDSIPRGQKLYFPAEEGPFQPPSPAGWDIKEAIQIFSDGQTIPEDKGFLAHGTGWAGGTAENSCIFHLVGDPDATGPGIGTGQRQGFYLHDCSLSGTGQPNGIVNGLGTGDYIRSDSVPFGFYCNVRIERVFFGYPGRSAIWASGLDAADLNNPINVTWSVRDCVIYGAGGHGIFATNMHFWSSDNLSISQCHGAGMIVCCGDGSSFRTTNFEGNGSQLTTQANPTRPWPGPWINEGFQIYDGAKYNASCVFYKCGSFDFGGSNVESWLKGMGDGGTGAAGGGTRTAFTLIGSRGGSLRGLEIGFGAGTDDDPMEAAGSRGVGLWDGSSCNEIRFGVVALVDKLLECDTTAHGNDIAAYATFQSSATSPGRIVMPATHRNTIRVTNRVGGLAHYDTGTVCGSVVTGLPLAEIDASVVQERLMFVDTSTSPPTLKIRLAGVWRTVNVT